MRILVLFILLIPGSLFAGEDIVVGSNALTTTGSSGSSSTITYIVRSGDTVEAIAQMFNVDISDLQFVSFEPGEEVLIAPSSIESVNQLSEEEIEKLRVILAEEEQLEELEKEAAEREKLESEAEEERLTKEREQLIQTALSSCDMAFFETMNTEEKMSTYDARQACAVKEVIVTESEIEILAAPLTESIIPSESTTQIESEPTPIQTTELEPAMPNSNPIELTEEPIQRDTVDTDQIVHEEQTQTDVVESTQKKSVVKRVWEFLFGWW